MWVGASPGSTGGGIKTTTFAIAILNIFNLATGRKHFVVGRREIPYNSVQRAFSVVFLSIITISLGSFLIITFHPNIPFLSILFECTSAFSTRRSFGWNYVTAGNPCKSCSDFTNADRSCWTAFTGVLFFTSR